jgi:hypothetical protein
MLGVLLLQQSTSKFGAKSLCLLKFGRHAVVFLVCCRKLFNNVACEAIFSDAGALQLWWTRTTDCSCGEHTTLTAAVVNTQH